MAQQAYILYCDAPHGFRGNAVAAQCPDSLRREIAVDLEVLQQSSAVPKLDPAKVLQVFGVAFTFVVFFFLLGRGLGQILNLIRKSDDS